jgi:hypothetical protein
MRASWIVLASLLGAGGLAAALDMPPEPDAHVNYAIGAAILPADGSPTTVHFFVEGSYDVCAFAAWFDPNPYPIPGCALARHADGTVTDAVEI